MLGWDRKAGSPHVGLRTTPYMTSATEGPTGDGEKRLALGFVQDNWLRGFSSLKTSCLGLNLELAGLRCSAWDDVFTGSGSHKCQLLLKVLTMIDPTTATVATSATHQWKVTRDVSDRAMDVAILSPPQ